MKFEEVLPALRDGKKVRINDEVWVHHLEYITLDDNDVVVDKYGKSYELDLSDLKDGRWEIVKETKRVKLRDLTEEQYEKWIDKRCEGECITCPVRFVSCYLRKPYSWIRNKDLYSDKFLDQEIEVEE